MDKELLSNITKIEQSLIKKERDKKWEVYWETQRKHHDAAKEFLASKDGVAALREFLRGIRPLTEALQTHRHKSEAFQPHFEKTDE